MRWSQKKKNLINLGGLAAAEALIEGNGQLIIIMLHSCGATNERNDWPCLKGSYRRVHDCSTILQRKLNVTANPRRVREMERAGKRRERKGKREPRVGI